MPVIRFLVACAWNVCILAFFALIAFGGLLAFNVARKFVAWALS